MEGQTTGLTAKAVEHAKGSAGDVTMARARELAEAARKLKAEGIDPLDQRQEKEAEAKRKKEIARAEAFRINTLSMEATGNALIIGLA